MSNYPKNIRPELDSGKDRERRNLAVVFLGFLLLVLAVIVLFFGSDLYDSFVGSDDGESTADQSVLEQAGAISATKLGDIAQEPDQSGYLEVGDEARDFALNDFEGKLVRLSDFRGQPVIVNFWATWCAPCRLEMPELQEAYDAYQDQGLVILALDQDEPLDRAREFFYDEMELSFTPLQDEGSAVSTAYSSYSVLPTTYFIDPEGKITAIHRGPLSLGLIEEYLDNMTLELS